jgi:hypothetical protein
MVRLIGVHNGGRKLTERNRSGRTHILIRHLVYHALEVVGWDLSLIQDDVVMDRTSSSLNSGMSTEVEVVFESVMIRFLYFSYKGETYG